MNGDFVYTAVVHLELSISFEIWVLVCIFNLSTFFMSRQITQDPSLSYNTPDKSMPTLAYTHINCTYCKWSNIICGYCHENGLLWETLLLKGLYLTLLLGNIFVVWDFIRYFLTCHSYNSEVIAGVSGVDWQFWLISAGLVQQCWLILSVHLLS